MKILFVKQLFNPEPTAKSLDFALELKNRGHEVQVLTGFPSYPYGKIYEGYKQKLWQKETIEGIEVIRVPIYPNQSDSGLKRMLHYLSFALSASVIGLSLIRKPDVAFVYQGAIPAAIPAIILKKFLGVPFLYDINDLWPDTVVVSGMMQNKFLLKIINKWCQLNYRYAAHISVATPGFKRKLMERNVPEEKITIVSNWSRDTFSHEQLPPKVRDSTFPKGMLNILYAGNLGVVQSLYTVIDAAEILQNNNSKQILFTFLGAGAERDNLVAYTKERDLKNIQFLPRVNSDEVVQYLNSADVLLVHLRNNELFKITIPSKILSYLRTGKPILLGLNGDAQYLVDEAEAGYIFEPENSIDLVNKIKDLLKKNGEEIASMGNKGKKYYDEFLSIESNTTKLIDCFKQCIIANERL